MFSREDAEAIGAGPSRPETRGAAATDATDTKDLLPQLIHDLRNPLAVMLSFAEIIPATDEAERAEFCARLATNAQRALHVLEDYALLSDLRGGRVELQVGESAWLPLVSAAVEDARVASGGTSSLACRGATPAIVRADGERLHCALRCLVREMLHTIGNAGKVSVEVGSAAGEAVAEIAVEFDPGVPFFSVLDGESLAVELARALAARHGGSFEIRTAPRSQVARLRLPAANRR